MAPLRKEKIDPIELFADLEDKLEGFSWRDMGEEDGAFLEELYATCHELEVLGIPQAERRQLLIQQSRLQLEQYAIAYTTANYWIFERGGKPLGRLIIDEDDDEVHLIDIGFLPEMRGAGWGRAVVQALQECARRRGKTVRCYVFVGNEAARRFWEGLGFLETGQEGLHLVLTWTLVSSD